MAEWFTTSENAINSTLKALVKSGYINKLGPNNAPEYTTNFEALMAKVEAEGALKTQKVYEQTAKKQKALLNQKGAQKAVEHNTTESVALLKQYGKGTETVVSKTTESVVSPINKIIYINKYSCCYSALTDEQKQEEQKQFFKIFFFKGANDPAEEVKRFIGHNQANGWQNKAGVKYDSTEKRLGLAELWEFKTGQRESKTFLKVWEEVYIKLADVENSDILLDPRIKFTYTADMMVINCPQAVARVIEANVGKVIEIFKAHAAGKKISYKFI